MEAEIAHGRVNPHHVHHETYAHKKNIKKGSERLDRRSGTGVHGQPKKSGHGGKFTWGGSTSQQEYDEDDSAVALDEKDPNYEDEEQKVENKKDVAETEEPGKSASAGHAKEN